MTISDIGTLQTAVESFVEDTINDALFLEFANAVADKLNHGVMGPDGRTWIIPPIRIKSMLTQTTLATSGGQATVPSTVLEYERIWINTSDGAPELLYYPLRQFRSHPDSVQSGTPTKYTIDGSTLYIAPTSDQTLQVSQYTKLGSFTGDSSTDAILTNHPNVYRAGVMAEVYRWKRDPDGMGMELAEFSALVKGLNAQDKMAQTSGSLLVMRPQGVS